MKYTYLPIILITLVIAACSSPEKEGDLEAKRKELETARVELATIKDKIAALEKEIGTADPAFAKQLSKAILVSTFVAERKPFEHKVEMRGSVESRKNILIASQTAGEVQRIHVREGQQVSKGQTLVSLNADVIRNSIAELENSLELANSVYERQAKLWEQKIGTELQYLQAKNNKQSLEGKLVTANSQLEQAIVKAPFSGTVDNIPAKEGEVAYPGTPLVRVVSQEDVYVKSDISERFIGKFKSGDVVDIYFPSMQKRLPSRISSVGQVINMENRTFQVEVGLPKVDFVVKPNQVVVLELRDYISEATLSVPTRLIQKDDEGQFIYTVVDHEGKWVARKIQVTAGISSGNQTEILEGLEGTEQIIDQGYRDMTEGVEVEIANAKAPKADTTKTVAKN